MKRFGLILTLAALFCLLVPRLAPFKYDEMSREEPGAAPSRAHLLGTDSTGRDRFSRLVYGTRISIALAPAAALVSMAIAAAAGGIAGMWPRTLEPLFLTTTDVFLSLPWMFLLITARALLPLNTSPEASAVTTFLLLGALGWAGPARIVRERVRMLLAREDRLLIRALGIGPVRAFVVHLIPNLGPALAAQFWISVPVFILSEANLSLIGLGVSEPLPSLGGMLRELESMQPASATPWAFAPLALLVTLIAVLQNITGDRRKKVL